MCYLSQNIEGLSTLGSMIAGCCNIGNEWEDWDEGQPWVELVAKALWSSRFLPCETLTWNGDITILIFLVNHSIDNFDWSKIAKQCYLCFIQVFFWLIWEPMKNLHLSNLPVQVWLNVPQGGRKSTSFYALYWIWNQL